MQPRRYSTRWASDVVPWSPLRATALSPTTVTGLCLFSFFLTFFSSFNSVYPTRVCGYSRLSFYPSRMCVVLRRWPGALIHLYIYIREDCAAAARRSLATRIRRDSIGRFFFIYVSRALPRSLPHVSLSIYTLLAVCAHFCSIFTKFPSDFPRHEYINAGIFNFALSDIHFARKI